MDTETELEVNEKTRHEDKVAHLQMIQGVIDRMSTSAAIYKGFAATIVTGIAAISFTEVRAWILLIAFLPVICFLVMDTYYLKLEKQYRILYEKIRNEKIVPDFSLDSRCSNTELYDANATWLKCLQSPSIWMFYVSNYYYWSHNCVVEICRSDLRWQRDKSFLVFILTKIFGVLDRSET